MNPTATQSRVVALPDGHETSALASPRESNSVQRLYQKLNRTNVQHDSNSQAIQNLTRTVEKIRRRILGGGVAQSLSWHFEDKIEVDPTKSYPAQTVIHIQPTHDLVTTGIRDAAAPSGGLVKSCTGYWVSTQAVPAKTTVSGNDVWNLPQYPYPKPTNLDDASNFWIYLGEMTC